MFYLDLPGNAFKSKEMDVRNGFLICKVFCCKLAKAIVSESNSGSGLEKINSCARHSYFALSAQLDSVKVRMLCKECIDDSLILVQKFSGVFADF